mgnify:FL=1
MATRFTGDVTRAGVLAYALATAEDPSTVGEVIHEAFNADHSSGGFAFHYDATLFIAGVSGGQSWAIDPVDAQGRTDAVESFWRVAQRHNRRIALDDLPEQTRAAIDALIAGARSVSDLRPQPLASDEERAGADYALVLLRRGARAATEAAALRVIARQDILLAPIPAHSFAHPCPLCGGPALGSPRYDRGVCDDCYDKPMCHHGRRVKGYNANLMGGFEAVHPDDRSVCDLTTTTGRITIDGFPAQIAEAHFGGVVISALLPPTITLVKGDITRDIAHAVVNPANERMRGGGGVDGAIHRAGGPAILADCIEKFPNGLATGDAGATTAGDLPARLVIHTVGPNYGAGQRDPALLASCYRRSLEVAEQNWVGLLAFPLISAGIYRWPLQDAADIAVDTIASTPSPIREVRIVVRDGDAYEAVERSLARREAAAEPPSLPDAEASLLAAQLASDVAALDALIADDLVFTGPDGATLGKQDDLTAHRTGATRFLSLDVLATGTHVLPTVTGPARGTSCTTAEVALATEGGPLELRLRWDRDWRVIDGRWQIVKASAAVVN